MNRIEQLQQTITELRIRGLEERAELRSLRHINSTQKKALDAAQAQIGALAEHVRQLHHRQAENIRQNDINRTVDAALRKGLERYGAAMKELANK